jgi:two-component system, chemotaxis family, CheB/CheR fusion protein
LNRLRRENNQVEGANMKDTAVRKILLVDDHQVACKSTAILLEISGYKVRTAFNGRTAIEIAGEFSPDIIILDIGLPDIGGYEVLNRLKQFKELQTAKFIALTGFEEETARQSQTGHDFHHFLCKPVDTTELKALLNN